MSVYDERVAKYGVNEQALLLNGTAQYKHAQANIPEGATVLDVGAGLCTLEEYLVNPASYTQIDSCGAVCAELGYLCSDLMNYDGDPVEYVCCYGVLDTVPPEQLQAFADKLKSLATVAVLFSHPTPTGNLLSNATWHQYTGEQIADAFGAVMEGVDCHNMCICRVDV